MRVGTPKFQRNHGFRRGQPVIRLNGSYALASTATGLTGVVGSIVSADQFELVTSGEIDNVPALIAAGDTAIWYLSGAAGVLSLSGTVPVGRVTGQTFLVQTVTQAGSVTNNITQGATASDKIPLMVDLYSPSNQGSDPNCSRADHRHGLQLPDWVYTGNALALQQIDPKTGMMRHIKFMFEKGLAKEPQLGPWHPYMEAIGVGSSSVVPSAGSEPVSPDLYHHVSSAATWAAGVDTVLLTPSTLSELLVVDNTPETAIVNVPANASGSWYGCILPVRFRNTAASATMRDWGMQFRLATGIPSGHLATVGVTNKDNLESPWLLDLGASGAVWSTKSEEDARVTGYNGEVLIYVYLGIGLPPGSEMLNPTSTAWTVTVDAWLI